MAKVQGTIDPRFQAVADAFQAHLDDQSEVGASITVNIDGKTVLDVYGGHKDPARTQAWEKDTIVNVWSSSKTVAGLCGLILIEKGLVDPFEKVSKYWPEFGVNGKENIEVRHLLSHTDGVSGWDKPMTLEDVYDIENSTRLLAEQAPWWEPGTASGYHSVTFGTLIGGLVTKVTGKSLEQFIDDEITKPLNADFQLGAREEDWSRVAETIPPPPGPDLASLFPKESLTSRTLGNPKMTASDANTPGWRRARLGACNGHSNSAGLNRALSCVSLGGTVDGVKILSPSTIDLIFKEQSRGPDKVLPGTSVRFGIGLALTGKDCGVDGWVPEGKICFWGGWGGSVVIMDVERKMTITYAMNKMENVGMGNERSKEYVKGIYKVVGVEFE